MRACWDCSFSDSSSPRLFAPAAGHGKTVDWLWGPPKVQTRQEEKWVTARDAIKEVSDILSLRDVHRTYERKREREWKTVEQYLSFRSHRERKEDRETGRQKRRKEKKKEKEREKTEEIVSPNHHSVSFPRIFGRIWLGLSDQSLWDLFDLFLSLNRMSLWLFSFFLSFFLSFLSFFLYLFISVSQWFSFQWDGQPVVCFFICVPDCN